MTEFRIIRYRDDGTRRSFKAYWTGTGSSRSSRWTTKRAEAKTFTTSDLAADEANELICDRGAPWALTVKWLTEWIDIEDNQLLLSIDKGWNG